MAKRKVSRPPAQSGAAVDSYNQMIIWLVYAILVLVPLVISRISYDQFDIVKLAIFRLLILAIVIVWLAKVLSSREPVAWSYRELLLLVFLGLAIASAFFSIDVQTSIHGKYKRYEGLLTFITYITAYFVALQAFREQKHVRALIEIVSVVGATVSLYGIMQYLGLDPIAWGNTPFEARRSFSTFGNPDLLAGYLVLALPCAIAAFFSVPERRWLHGSATFVLAVGLLTAFTRSGWLGAVVGVGALLVLSGSNIKRYRREIGLLAAAFVIVFAAILIHSASNPELRLTSKIKGAFQFHDGGTASQRFEIWKAGWSMVKDRPLLGQGLDTYRLASQRFETERYVKGVAGTTVSDNAHNYFIQLAAGGGPAAALALYAFFISWIARMVKIRSGLKTDAERMLVSGAAAAGAGYLVTMFLGISIVGAGSTFWILMGAMAGYTKNVSPAYYGLDLRPRRWLKPVLASAFLVVTLFGAVAATAMYAGDIYFRKGLVAPSAQASHSYLSSAISLYPGNGRIMAQQGQRYLKLADLARANQDQAGYQKAANRALAAFELAAKAEPLEIDYQLDLANAHLYLGNIDQAIALLDRVIERRPYSVAAHFLLGQIKERRGQKIEAIEHYETMFALAPKAMDVSSRLAALYKETGDDVKAARFEAEAGGPP
jgi:O-antigen ligase/Flp pilus assembly protein TadD